MALHKNASLVEEPTQETSSVEISEPEVTVLIVSEMVHELEPTEYWILLTFVLPLLFSMPFHRWRKGFIFIQILQAAYIVWLAFFILYAVYDFYKPLYGGYLLSVLACLYGLLTVLEWLTFIKQRRYE